MQPWQQTRWQQETSSSRPRWDPRLCFLPRIWPRTLLTTACCIKEEIFRFLVFPFGLFQLWINGSEAKVVLQATEWKMMWLVLDGSQMNECIFDFWLKWSCNHETFYKLLQSEGISVWFYFMCHALLSFSVRAPCCTDSLVDTGLFVCFFKYVRILFLVLQIHCHKDQFTKCSQKTFPPIKRVSNQQLWRCEMYIIDNVKKTPKKTGVLK